jgi:Flp pilus assembly pilin Flp
MVRRKTKAQSLVEYAVLAACIAGALIGMQFYMKRAIQGRVKQAGDEIGEPYDAAATKSEITTKVKTLTTITSTPITDSVTGDVTSIKSDIKQIENITRTGTEKISAWGDGTLNDEVTSSGSSGSLGDIIGPSLYSSIGGTAVSGYTYSLAGGHTSAEVEAKFTELYSSNLGQRYSNPVNAVTACLQELDKLSYIDLKTE